MSDGISYQSGRKKYESNKTLAQIWTGRAILGGVILIVGFFLYQFGFNFYLLFAKPDLDGPLIWATKQGIGYSAKGGERSGVFKLPSVGGEVVENPRFAVVGGNLVYFNPANQSLCITNGDDTPRWIMMENQLGPDATIRDIRPIGGNAAILVAYPKAADPDALGSPAAAFRYTMGAGDVTPMDPQDVELGPENKSVARTAGGFTGVTGAPKTVVSWDYDFGTSTLFASEGKSVAAIRSGGRTDFGLGPLYFIRHVQATGGEVWLTAVKPFRSGHLLLSYGPDGRFRRLKLKDEAEIRPPFVKVTPEMLEVLNKVSGGVTE